ncbi:MAG: DNA/RNA non-specific endonuclease [Clostridia bacterium]|nr:DNA/RNA non-specific endonuclease [Clostridia bacterium]
MKKLISIILALSLLLTFAGCGDVDNSSSNPNESGYLSSVESVDSSVEGDENNNSSDQTTASDKPQNSSNIQGTASDNVPTSKPANSSKPSNTGTGQAQGINLKDIPAYSGNAYVVINNNVPGFSAAELTSVGYETYSNLDSLGRTKTALASVGKDTMPKPSEERESISDIKPTGWQQKKYDSVNGGWLYNRCHLIGWQLSAENANSKNLITGTQYLNISGMLPFENMVADYIKETGNHVAYRITPIYDGNNLLASGVQMEAYSVEDNGAGICFNVYCYNVQPNITINYATGASSSASDSNQNDSNQNDSQNDNTHVYITKTGAKYHSTSSCSGLKKAKAIYDSTVSEAKSKGLTPCSICY